MMRGGMHQPSAGDEDEDASTLSGDYPDHIGWDANGSPVEPDAMPTWQPEPLHPLMREQQEPHVCWICERATPRTLMGEWLIALVLACSGKCVRFWVCSSACQQIALMLLSGMVTLERWCM